MCLHLPFNRVNHLFQGASLILIVATLQDADFAEIRTFFYDSKCRSISFFLLSFLASKVEAISCIIMSEGICIYIHAGRSGNICLKWSFRQRTWEKKKRMRWQRKKTEPSPSPSQPPVWHCIVWYTASSNQNQLSIQKLVTLHNKNL